MRKFTHISLKVFGVLMSIAVVVFAFGLIFTALNIGGLRGFVVESDSMAPSMPRGSLIVVKPFGEYYKGDAITFSDPGGNDFYVTHRIVRQTDERFVTKGDANEDNDSEAVTSDLVVGKVVGIFPYLGYPVTFSKTREGLILLLIIPTTFIVYGEIVNIVKEVKMIAEKRTAKA